jgi:hypothetical protein
MSQRKAVDTYLELLHVGKNVVGILCDHRSVVVINVVLEGFTNSLELKLASVVLLGAHTKPVIVVLIVVLKITFAPPLLTTKPVGNQFLKVNLNSRHPTQTVNVHLRNNILIAGCDLCGWRWLLDGNRCRNGTSALRDRGNGTLIDRVGAAG